MFNAILRIIPISDRFAGPVQVALRGLTYVRLELFNEMCSFEFGWLSEKIVIQIATVGGLLVMKQRSHSIG